VTWELARERGLKPRAAEALAWDLLALKRATIVGEPAPGGTHGTTIDRVTDHFGASIPFCRSIIPVIRSEGAGVKSDVAVPVAGGLSRVGFAGSSCAIGHG
jgi:hypothetical protein